MWPRLLQFWRWIYPPVLFSTDDPEWKIENKWYCDASPKGETKYASAKEYADKFFSWVTDVNDAIDKKAEWLFGISFTAVGALMAAVHSWNLSAYWSSPALLGLFLSLTWSLRTRLPVTQTYPVTIRGSLAMCEGEPSWEFAMSASTHLAADGMIRTIAWKSRQLRKSAGALIAAAALFFIFPVMIGSPVATDPPSKAESRQGGAGTDSRAEWAWRWEWVPPAQSPEPARKAGK
jgi:hypothetical protein